MRRATGEDPDSRTSHDLGRPAFPHRNPRASVDKLGTRRKRASAHSSLQNPSKPVGGASASRRPRPRRRVVAGVAARDRMIGEATARSPWLLRGGTRLSHGGAAHDSFRHPAVVRAS
jgi:hypothetical protein